MLVFKNSVFYDPLKLVVRSNMFSIEERAVACLQAVAVGDAMGHMTELYEPDEILRVYGGRIVDLQKPLPPLRVRALPPRFENMIKNEFEWKCGEITDDTTFTVHLAESIIQNRGINQRDFVRRIIRRKINGWPRWDEFQRIAFNKKKLERFARGGFRNGAPMRVSPIGIIHTPDEVEMIVKDVELSCIMTHSARSALSAACAMAAAVSAAIEGWSESRVINFAMEASKYGESLGFDDDRPRVSDRLKIGIDIIDRFKGRNLVAALRRKLSPGFVAVEGVSFALCLAYGIREVKNVILEAVNQGGDADSVASMAGCIAAAWRPNELPKKWIEKVEEVNNLHLAEIAARLLELRRGSD